MVRYDAQTSEKGTDWIAIRIFGIGLIHHAGLQLASCLRAPLASVRRIISTQDMHKHKQSLIPTGLCSCPTRRHLTDERMGETRDQRKRSWYGLPRAHATAEDLRLTSAPECLWEDSSRANGSKITASFQSLRSLHAVHKGQGCV